ncbi:Endonuclease/exonuclease/phosphatase [Rhodocollybia butyracea]|uniref:Endonuclease/exonuclease/phosphatase n=1 Tax=Rhodocollybia butyracea TaxID=206335 RepID=A0A9P5P8J8_9AGAR|nr:Endonuclease/exonuclease/phosphatase [Rhodocollybia butyracea]
MRGYGTPNVYHRDNKWKYINNLVKKKKIGILALQETHLTDERREQIEQRYAQRLKIFISMDPENPTGQGGVAVVLNKELARTDTTKSIEIVPGRALLVEVQWHKEEKIAILAIYAPNVTGSDGKENAKLWKDVKTYYNQHPRTPKPKVLLGDFNMVESGMIDRWPAHNDPEEAIEALDELKIKFNLKDEWRNTHPGEKRYTYIQTATNSQSRLDRIYIAKQLQQTTGEWKIEPSGIPNADHSLTMIGKGRWTVPAFLLKDKGFLEYVHEKGLQAERKHDSIMERTMTDNPQIIWHELKTDILGEARRNDCPPNSTKIAGPHHRNVQSLA